ncbi:MAG: metallophosphoesterase family protein [Solirubrobacterales bacterium]|nr:metallophosphoesterase family protein [Solirubrobacterales bacterium]
MSFPPASRSRARIAIVSDTHMPKGERRIPARALELMAASETTVHAGDISTLRILRELEELGPPVHAVHGNVDEPALVDLLPAERRFFCFGKVIVVVHDAGPARGRIERLRARYPEADAVVFGHSHIPLHERAGKFQIFNPGSPTERRRAPQRSLGLLSLEAGELRFEHVWLGVSQPAVASG